MKEILNKVPDRLRLPAWCQASLVRSAFAGARQAEKAAVYMSGCMWRQTFLYITFHDGRGIALKGRFSCGAHHIIEMNTVKHAPHHQGIVVGVEIIAQTMTVSSPLAKKREGVRDAYRFPSIQCEDILPQRTHGPRALSHSAWRTPFQVLISS